MALMPCAYCHRVPRGKLHAMIWAHHGPAGRQAWRTRSCAEDLPNAIEAFGAPLPEEGDYVQLPTDCQLCSEPLKPNELAVTYLTWYEGDGKHSAMYATCYRDSDERWAAIREIGEQLEERERWIGSRRH